MTESEWNGSAFHLLSCAPESLHRPTSSKTFWTLQWKRRGRNSSGFAKLWSFDRKRGVLSSFMNEIMLVCVSTEKDPGLIQTGLTLSSARAICRFLKNFQKQNILRDPAKTCVESLLRLCSLGSFSASRLNPFASKPRNLNKEGSTINYDVRPAWPDSKQPSNKRQDSQIKKIRCHQKKLAKLEQQPFSWIQIISGSQNHLAWTRYTFTLWEARWAENPEGRPSQKLEQEKNTKKKKQKKKMQKKRKKENKKERCKEKNKKKEEKKEWKGMKRYKNR